MSTIVSQAEASKPQQQKKMQECFKCKAAGFPNELIGFEKIGEDPRTGKNLWKLIDENGIEHIHRYLQNTSTQQQQIYQSVDNNNNTNPVNRPVFRRRRVVDIATLTDVEEARKLLAQGWDFQTSYPATISHVPHYVLVRKE
ncbi:MAG TPA: hypothetical protein VIP70_06890 [Nitrososphaeraceae archaeon]|jgi:hypothetical protein